MLPRLSSLIFVVVMVAWDGQRRPHLWCLLRANHLLGIAWRLGTSYNTGFVRCDQKECLFVRNVVFLREFRASLLKAVKYPCVRSVKQRFERGMSARLLKRPRGDWFGHQEQVIFQTSFDETLVFFTSVTVCLTL